MLGEKEILPQIENQYVNLLNFIDSLDLSYDSRIDLYRRFQNELFNRSIQVSMDYGRKLEEQSRVFTEKEEATINMYVAHFNEHGLDEEILFLQEPSKRDLQLIEEAKRRVRNTGKTM